VNVIHLVRLRNTSIFEQLQIEEALIRADKRNWCLLNDGSGEAIVMGISGKPEQLINTTSLPVIRRFSGGGTVLVDENTCFVTVICNHSALDVTPFPKQILNWNGRLYHSLATSGFSIEENDYALNGKKFGGNAQYITKNRWLHHSTLLWDFDPEKMKALKMPPKTPAYRQGRAHEDFLCRLKDYLPHKDELFDQVVESLGSSFIVKEIPQSLLKNATSASHRRSTTIEA
jgi:lipoate---protein ligase